MDRYDVSLVGTLHHISCALRVFVFASWKSERVQSHASHESRERTENRESREKFESRKQLEYLQILQKGQDDLVKL